MWSPIESAVPLGLLAVLVVLGKWISVRRNWPLPPLLLLSGFIGAQSLQLLSLDSSLSQLDFHGLVYYLLLPLLVYDIAFRLNADCLLHNFLMVMILAVPLMLIEVLMAAALLYAGIDQPAVFSVVAALIAAALIAANDPVAIDRVLRGVAVPSALRTVLEGESLFNSILALVLVSLALQVESQHASLQAGVSFLEGFFIFVRLFSGGVLLGFVLGLIGWGVLHYVRWPASRVLLSLAIAFVTWSIAEQLAQVSGVVAVLTAGLLLNGFAQRIDAASSRLLGLFWYRLGTAASMLMFLLLGVSLPLDLLQASWPVVLLGIVALLVSRGAMVFAGLGFWNLLGGKPPVPMYDQQVLMWGNIKGAVTIAMLFSLPSGLPYSETIRAIVYGVMLFSLLVQAPILRWITKRPDSAFRFLAR